MTGRRGSHTIWTQKETGRGRCGIRGVGVYYPEYRHQLICFGNSSTVYLRTIFTGIVLALAHRPGTDGQGVLHLSGMYISA